MPCNRYAVSSGVSFLLLLIVLHFKVDNSQNFIHQQIEMAVFEQISVGRKDGG
jgi:hypothetical protein